KGQQRVGGAIHEVAGRLPFLMLGPDSDNGSEFINNNLCRPSAMGPHKSAMRPCQWQGVRI
ncbi:MAG: hypothetical protein QGI09_06040, partial [Dehalococcoidia bacterium]|nr:hypothetical protein [Dehalococcoidia bacterium]